MNRFSKFILVLFALMAAISLSAQRIAILTDLHITPGNANTPKLIEAINEINADRFDLVVISGDLCNEGSDEELINVKAILDQIKHPSACIPGNHELTWSQSATKTFFDLWGNDRFVTEVGDLIVVGISCGPYMKMGDGHIKQEDLHWLRTTLNERVKPGKRVLSINHYPLKDDLDNYIEYVNLLSDYPVIAHINGHYHRWIEYQGGTIPGIMVRALNMSANGVDDYGYSIVEIDENWIHVFNKQLGKDPQPKFFAKATVAKHTPIEAPKVEWTSPAGFQVDKVWADSASVFTRVAVDHNNVYFGNSLGYAKAVSKADGKLQWSVATGASLFSRPVVLPKGKVAIPAATGIYMVNSADGSFRTKDFLASKEGPYVADGIICDRGWVQGAYKRIELRKPSNGKLIWSYDSINNYCQAAAVADGDELFFGAWDTYLRCLDLHTGKLRWKWSNGKTANMLGPGNVVPVVTADKVIVVAPDRYMTAIDRATGQQIWRDKSHKYRESLGHSEDLTRVYAKTMDGELVAVDATSSEFRELWMVDMGLGYEHAPCIVAEVDGVVFAGSRHGVITAVDPIAQKVIWSLPLGTSEVNGIDIDPTTNDIYVSLIEGTIFRISKK